MRKIPLECLILLLFGATAWAGGVTIDPGSSRLLTQDPATGASSSDNGNITFTLISIADPNTRTLQARSATLAGTSIGTGSASSQIFYEFEVGSTAETAGNTVGAWVSYVVDWSGLQALLAVGASNAAVEVELVLRDMTGPANLHFEPVHQLDLQTHKVKFVLLGLNLNDSGIKPSTFSAVLRRGRTYRLTLRMTASTFLLQPPGAGSFAESSYLGDGVRLLSLNVKLGIDEREVLERLEGFGNHRHVYLTGRGNGHNNVEAASSPPIFEKPAVSPKMFPQMFLDEDLPMTKPEVVTTDKPILRDR